MLVLTWRISKTRRFEKFHVLGCVNIDVMLYEIDLYFPTFNERIIERVLDRIPSR